MKPRKAPNRKPKGARPIDDAPDPDHLFEFRDRVTLVCKKCPEHTIGIYIPERREGVLAELRRRGWLKD